MSSTSVHRKVSDVTLGSKLSVRIVPVLKDNYSYILYKTPPTQQQHHVAAASKFALIDVSADFEPVLRECKNLLGLPSAADIRQVYQPGMFEIFTTHRHFDHQGGNEPLAKLFPHLRIVGGEHEPVAGKTESAPENFQGHLRFDEDIHINVLHVPYHTRGHVLFHFYHPSEKDVAGACFTGDAIFYAGCGAVNTGGTTHELISCFKKAATHLPAATSLFCGHNYLNNFINYAKFLEPHNMDIQETLARCQHNNAVGLPNVPSTVEQEMKVNPFMKVALGMKEFLSTIRVPESDRISQEKTMEWVYNNCP